MTESETDKSSEMDDQQRILRNETNAQFVFLLKEKEALKSKLELKEREMAKLRSQNYDLLKDMEKLEAEVGKKKSGNTGAKGKDTTKHPAARPKARKQSMVPKSVVETNNKRTITPEQPPGNETKDTQKHYQEIAEKFPDIKLSAVLLAEKKFIEADSNRSGTIDADELERLLDRNDLMFTKKQVQEILKEVDLDNSQDLDFFECLAVIEKLQHRRKTNLPQSIQNAQTTKSSMCLIQ